MVNSKPINISMTAVLQAFDSCSCTKDAVFETVVMLFCEAFHDLVSKKATVEGACVRACVPAREVQ